MIIDLDSETHPQADVTSVDLERGIVNFRWVGAEYSGECAVEYQVNPENFVADCTAAIQSLLTPA